MTEGSDDSPKLHIDDDWKAEAQKEKAKLAESAKPAAGEAGADGSPASAGGGGNAGGGGMPPANFETLVSTMVTQALFAMGAIPDPRTGERYAQLDLARHHIDMLSILEEKTKGNVSDEEADMLKTSLYELRSRYIQLANQARTQAGASPASSPASPATPEAPGIIT